MEQAVTVEESRTASRPGLTPDAPTSPLPSPVPSAESAKQYARIKLVLALFSTLFFFLLTLFLVASGVTRILADGARGVTGNEYLALICFVASLFLFQGLIMLPLQYYSGYSLEHRFGLSNQTRLKWAREGVKGGVVGAALMTPMILVLYYCLRTYGPMWWVPVGAIMFLFSVILARLAPVILFPLFYKFKPIEEGGLKSAIVGLCNKVGLPVQGVFVFDMSRNTKKANAAFTGIGKSRRILLGDTLVANCTDEEIEAVVAHELGHYKLRHLWVMMGWGAISTFLGLFATAWMYGESLSWLGFSSLHEIAALPLLGLWFGVYSLLTAPLSNMLSRRHEYAADRFAVRLSGKKNALQHALQKLATVNLADPSPHVFVEWLFHSHPSIKKRIRAVEAV